MKIYAPVKGVNGIYASVRFVNGVGETDNPKLIDWFKSHGYTVGDGVLTVSVGDKVVFEEPIEKEIVEVKSDKKDFDNMTPLELREWAIANGLGSKIRNTRNKEKLLEIIRG